MTRLQFERVNRRISQERLALVTGVPQPVICLIERGTWNPNPNQLAALAHALGVAPSDLLAEVVLPESQPRTAESRTEERQEAAAR